jgi:hypothetical protein
MESLLSDHVVGVNASALRRHNRSHDKDWAQTETRMCVDDLHWHCSAYLLAALPHNNIESCCRQQQNAQEMCWHKAQRSTCCKHIQCGGQIQ